MLGFSVKTKGASTVTAITGSTALWYASRATGVVSLLLLSLVVILGILINRQGRLPGLPSFALTGLHRSVSLLSVLFIAAHVATAVIDPYVSIRAVAIVIPFVSAYLPFWLGLGAVALDLIAALILTSLIRARIGKRLWRGVHWLAYLAWPVALAHGIGASPDLRSGGLRLLTIGAALAVGGAALWRATHAMQQVPRSERAAAAFTHARSTSRRARRPGPGNSGTPFPGPPSPPPGPLPSPPGGHGALPAGDTPTRPFTGLTGSRS